MYCLFGPQTLVLVLSLDKPIQLDTRTAFNKVLTIYSCNISDNFSGRFLKSNNFTFYPFSESYSTFVFHNNLMNLQ